MNILKTKKFLKVQSLSSGFELLVLHNSSFEFTNFG